MKRISSFIAVVCLGLAILISGCADANTRLVSATGETVSREQDDSQQVPSQGSVDPLGRYDPFITVSAVNCMISADVKFNEGEDINNNVWTKAYLDELGIKANVWWGADNTDKMNLMVATGKLPDIFGLDSNNFEKLGRTGKLEDLTEIYEKYASPLTKELLLKDGGRALEACKVNGRLYAIPYYQDPTNDPQALFVREDWLKRAGLTPPGTMDELFNICKTFAEGDFDGNGRKDTTGLYLHDTYDYCMKGVFGAFHAYPYIWVRNVDGKLVNGKVQADVMKPALSWLQNAYKQGLISKEFPLKNSDLWEEDTARESYGVIYGQYWLPEWPLQQTKNLNANSEWKAYAFPTADGKPAKMSLERLDIRHYFVVRKGAANPEAMIKMVNLASEKLYGKNAELNKFDVDPVTTSNIWKYTLALVYSPKKDMDAFINVSVAVEKKDPAGLNIDQKVKYEKIMKFIGGDRQYWWVAGEYGPGGSLGVGKSAFDNGLIMYNGYFGANTENMQNYDSKLQALYNDTLVNIILNNASVDTYDRFVENWRKLGGDAITKDVNAWYDKMK